jgi:hypothetical protein
MEFQPWHAVAGWITIKIIEWAAVAKRSVLTEAEHRQLQEMQTDIKEGRLTAKEVTDTLKEISINQRETAVLLKQVTRDLHDLEHRLDK